MNDSAEADRLLVDDAAGDGIRHLLGSALGFAGFAVEAAGGLTDVLGAGRPPRA